MKPGNIMVSDEGRVKVLDFGLAKVLEGRGEDAATATQHEPITSEGQVVGTVRQARSGSREVGGDLVKLSQAYGVSAFVLSSITAVSDRFVLNVQLVDAPSRNLVPLRRTARRSPRPAWRRPSFPRAAV